MQGIVERQDKRYIYVNLGKIEAVLSKQDQMPNEFYQPHDRIKVYVSRVENTSKGPQVFVSRSHPDLLRVYLNKKYQKFMMESLKSSALLVKRAIVQKLLFVQMIKISMQSVHVLDQKDNVSKQSSMN